MPQRIALLGATILGAAAFAAPAHAAIVAPPGTPGVTITVFPTSNIAIADGLPAGTVDVLVRRGGTIIGKAPNVTVSAGAVEINHGPELCWDTFTPDILPGDVVQVLTTPNNGWEMIVSNVSINPSTVSAAGDVTGTGSAVLAAGEVLGVRLVKGAGGAHLNTGDPNTSLTHNTATAAYTATFTQPAAPNSDVEAIVVNGGAVTIAEPVGSQACPDKPVASTAMTSLSGSAINIANQNEPITVSGVASGDHTVAISVNGGAAQNATVNGGTWTFQIPVALLPDGPVQVTAQFGGTAPPPDQTRTILKDTLAPLAPTATPAPGTYATAQSVTIDREQGAAVRYTIGGPGVADPTASTGTIANGPIPITASQTVKAIVVDAAGNTSPVATFAYTITAPVQQNTGGDGAAAGGGATGGVTTIFPAPALGGSTAGHTNTNTVAPAQLALKRLSTAAKVKRSTARLRGIGLSMELASGTNVVKINIYRRSGGKLKLISSGFKATSNSGVYRVRQNHAALRRQLRIGSYEVQVTPGRSRTDLGTTSKASLKIVR